jgi:cytochrome c2
MSVSYYNPRRLHVVFAAAALMLLAATVWMVAADQRRPWKEYQRQYNHLTGLRPQPPAIEQIWLPELTIDYHFRRVARSDRCTTCHQGIDKPAAKATRLPQPYAAHPRLDLFLSASSPHPMTEFGCTVCHDGQGSATDFHWASHSPNDAAQRRRWQDELGWSVNPHWDWPMLASRFHQSRCLACHQNVTELDTPPTDPAAAKLAAGYQLVRQYGCSACHEIPQFREASSKVGPSLRNVADRLRPEYLTDRIGNPANFQPSTRMPRLFGLHEHLEGQTLTDTRRSEEGEIGNIVQYLGRSEGGAAKLGGSIGSPSPERGKRLFETQGCLACHRHADFPRGSATQGPDLSNVGAKYLAGVAQEWLTSWLRDPAQRSPQMLMPNPLLPTVLEHGGKMTDPAADLAAYLSGGGGQNDATTSSSRSNTIHDDLGRRAIAKRGCAGCHDIAGFESAPPIGPALGDWGRKPESLLAFERIDEFVKEPPSANSSAGVASDDGFFRDALLAHRRDGFLWQKLRMPRSFDYKLAQDKPFDSQLKMGRFELSDAQREAIVTFILGLGDETPAARYVYRPDRRREAIIAGRKVLDKYACAECHELGLEQWTLDGKTTLSGVPRLDLSGDVQQDEDDDGKPIMFFTLWEPARIAGHDFPVGGADVVVAKSQLGRVRQPWGGTLARLLYPVVLRQARQSGSSAAEVEAWGWLPPSLVHEGAIVRPEWLYRYLLDPTVIRPAAVLRMPRFNLLPDEARKLTDYFAAVSGVEYPYTAKPAIGSGPLDIARMDKAMRLLLDRNVYCAKCHLIGDDRPAGDNRTILAPRLDEVAGRLRPEYVRRWLAEPKSVLPYTAMPAHFSSADAPLGQDLFPGSAREQLDAVAELLIRYD